MRIPQRKKRGFTLIELLLSIVIISIIFSLVILALSPSRMLIAVYDARRHSNAYELNNALLTYIIGHSELPVPQAEIPIGEENAEPMCRHFPRDSSECIDVSDLVPETIARIPVDGAETNCNFAGFKLFRNGDLTSVFPSHLGLPDRGRIRIRNPRLASTTFDLTGITNNYPTVSASRMVRFADTDFDGDLDMINPTPTSLSVFINKGDGTFAQRVDYATSTDGRSFDVADVNGDCYPDVVVGIWGGGLKLYMNYGDGTYAAPEILPTDYGTLGATIGDVNNDDFLDIIAANWWDNLIHVLINHGDGTFEPYQSYSVAGRPRKVVIGDLNNDDFADVSTNSDTEGKISVLLNNGDGTFGSRTDYTYGGLFTFTRGVDMGDINNDGETDIAVAAHGNCQYFSIFSNLGSAVLINSGLYDLNCSLPDDVRLAHFNSDQFLDAAVANNNGTVSVFFNDGDGTFTLHQNYTTGTNTQNVAVGDIDRSGLADIAAVNEDSLDITIINF